MEAWSLEAWKRLARGLEEAWSTSWEWSWELKFHEKCLTGEVKRPTLHAKSAKRKARKAKEAPKMTKLIPQMVPKPTQDASSGSLGGDF